MSQQEQTVTEEETSKEEGASISTRPFVARCKSAEGLKALAQIISTLTDEATFEATVDGLKLRCMDPSHIALIDVQWPKEGFELYECDSPVKFGVRMDEFLKVIRRADKKDSVQLTIGNDAMLHIDMAGGGYPRSYKSKMIDSSAGDTPMPKLNFNTRIETPVDLLDRVLSDVQVVSEYVEIEAKGNKPPVFSGRGDTGESKVTLGAETVMKEVTCECKEDSKATYSLDYLAKAIKAALAGESIKTAVIEFSSKMPLRFELTSTTSKARVHYYLAPRVQD
jgi:proliferating cell nuclear antigen